MQTKRLERLRKKINDFPVAEIVFKADWDCEIARVGGKMFAMIGAKNKSEQTLLTVKGSPEYNEYWRQKVPQGVIPGYYANKVHWNSYDLDNSELRDDDILEVFETAYKLQVSQLTKKIREELGL